jgi:GntR family transcriptional regulator
MDTSPARRPGPPRYMQLAAAFRRPIASNQCPLGAQVRTVEALAEEYGVARITIRQAMGVLEAEGLVERSRGRGTRVTARPHSVRWHRLTGSWDDFMWRSPGGGPACWTTVRRRGRWR